VNPKYTTTVYFGLSKLGTLATSASGCSNGHCKDYNADHIKDAVVGADLVVVALGSGHSLESEDNDRAYLDLPGSQLDLLKDAVYYGETFINVT
jgi:beta-glucosidase